MDPLNSACVCVLLIMRQSINELTLNALQASEEPEERETLMLMAARGESEETKDGETYIEKYTCGEHPQSGEVMTGNITFFISRTTNWVSINPRTPIDSERVLMEPNETICTHSELQTCMGPFGSKLSII